MPRKPSNAQLQAEVTQSTSGLVSIAASNRGMSKAEYIRQAVYDALVADGFDPQERLAGRGTYPRYKDYQP